MKTKFYLLFASLAVFLLNTACDDDNSTFDSYESIPLLSFAQNEFELSIPQEDFTLEIPVNISSLSSESRTFNTTITSASDGTSNEYSIGTITIPANQYSGILTVDFDFSSIGGMDGDIKELIVSIDVPDGTGSYSDEVTINYFREIVCNDLSLTIVSDTWATETYFTLEDAAGNVLADRFFPFTSNAFGQVYEIDFTLPDGDYVLKIGDVFGDGMVSAAGNGSYSLTCSIITHASGGGDFRATPDPFTGAPDAIVEVTEFSINP